MKIELDLDHREQERVTDRLLLTGMLGALFGASIGALAAWAALVFGVQALSPTTGVYTVPPEIAVPVAAVVGLAWGAAGYFTVRSEWRDIGVLDP